MCGGALKWGPRCEVKAWVRCNRLLNVSYEIGQIVDTEAEVEKRSAFIIQIDNLKHLSKKRDLSKKSLFTDDLHITALTWTFSFF